MHITGEQSVRSETETKFDVSSELDSSEDADLVRRKLVEVSCIMFIYFIHILFVIFIYTTDDFVPLSSKFYLHSFS